MVRKEIEMLRRRQARGRLDVGAADLRAGALVVGARGAGKTTALTALVDEWAGPHRWVSGVLGSAERLVAELIGAPVVDADPRWAAAAALRESGAALVVDDAHLLDEGAALVVYSLAVQDGLPVFLSAVPESVRAGWPALTAIWKDRHLPRCQLRELDRTEASAEVDARLRALAAPEDVATMLRWAGESTAAFIELVDASIDTDCWDLIAGVAVLARRPPLSDLLWDLLSLGSGSGVSGVGDSGSEDSGSGPVWRIVEYLAAADSAAQRYADGWLPLDSVLARFPLADLIEAERRRLVEADERHVRLRVPMLADLVLREQVSLISLAATRGEFAPLIAATRLDGADADRASLIAVELAAASPQPPTVEMRLAAGAAALRLCDPLAAVRMLGGWEAADALPGAALPLAWAALLSGERHRLDALVAGHVDDPEWRSLLGVAEVWQRYALGPRKFLAELGETPQTVLTDLRHRSGSDPVVGAWTALLVGVAASLAGDPELSAAALGELRAGSHCVGMLELFAEATEVSRDSFLGDAAAAARRADRFAEPGHWSGPRARVIIGLTAAGAYLAVGRTDDAAVQLALGAVVAGNDPWSGQARASLAFINRGEADEPQPAPEGDDLALGLWVVGNGAWQLVLDGRIRDATELLVAEAHRAVDRGALAIAAEHCELALRFGADTPLPVALTESGDAAPQRFRTLLRYHAAWSARDGAALDEVGAAYLELGRRPVATDVFAQAAQLHRRAGDPRRASASMRQARALNEAVGGRLTPAQQAAALAHPGLTRRELEVTALVCRGLTNREIAERLSLSVRTIEGYVLRACDKAGVSSRRELAELDLRADLPVSPRS